jgi:hypothetical protein
MITTVLLGLAALQGSAPMLSSHDPQTIVRYMQS